jgi:hypothetical protein
MAVPTDAYAGGAFLSQKRSKAGDSPDADLAQESELKAGAADDPDKVTDSQSLGLRHRRRYGYSAEGAEENDANIATQGRKPLHVVGHRRSYSGGRTAHFEHGVVSHNRPTSVVSHKRPTTVVR